MSSLVATAYIGLGGNLGDRPANLRLGLRRLAVLARLDAVSSLYETEAVGPPQPPYYNAVCRIATGLEPLALLRFLKAIEGEAGRPPQGPRWGPRPLDLDLLLYDEETIESEQLTVPHRRLPERAFVLVPLCELAPELRHPTQGRTMREMLAELDATTVTKVAERGWVSEPPKGRAPRRKAKGVAPPPAPRAARPRR